MGYDKAPAMYRMMEEGDEEKNRLGCLAITFVNEDAASPEDPEAFLNLPGLGTEDKPYWMPRYVKIKAEDTLRHHMPFCICPDTVDAYVDNAKPLTANHSLRTNCLVFVSGRVVDDSINNAVRFNGQLVTGPNVTTAIKVTIWQASSR
jgi:hypothetical protein